ncbi:MAG: Trm112 family protein [Candidatus Diapherotrites archaeon]|nr:Trm112 family protein [Candidatus Diapherotrites archaeon]
MPLSQELLQILVCPQCKGELAYLVEKSKLACKSCKLAFLVENNIPILLIDQAVSI